MSHPKTDSFASIDAIPADAIPAAIARLAARAMTTPPATLPRRETSAAALLTPDQAAKLLGMSRKYVYRHSRELGAIRLGRGSRGRLRFSAAKLARVTQ